jgi:hypothetical protein
VDAVQPTHSASRPARGHKGARWGEKGRVEGVESIERRRREWRGRQRRMLSQEPDELPDRPQVEMRHSSSCKGGESARTSQAHKDGRIWDIQPTLNQPRPPTTTYRIYRPAPSTREKSTACCVTGELRLTISGNRDGAHLQFPRVLFFFLNSIFVPLGLSNPM